MARLDYYRRPGPTDRGFLLDVQSNSVADLKTRAVMLLVPIPLAPAPIRELNPVFQIADQSHVLLTQSIASIPVKELRGRVGSLDNEHDKITRAIDILLVGY